MPTNPDSSRAPLIGPLLDIPPRTRAVVITLGLAGVVMVVVASLESAQGRHVEVDKLLHFGGYLTLAFLFVVGLPARLYVPGLVGLLLLGVGIEIIQPLQGRTFDWNDQIANSIGVAAGTALGLLGRFLFALLRTELAARAQRRRTRHVRPGTVVFRQGDPSTDLYAVLAGSVRLARVVKGYDDELEIVKQGGVFGEMGVIRDAPRYATAIALEETSLYRVDVDALRVSCGDASPSVSVVRALAQRLHEADERLGAAQRRT